MINSILVKKAVLALLATMIGFLITEYVIQYVVGFPTYGVKERVHYLRRTDAYPLEFRII
jgi:hypothetical protein